jgi:ACT domain-containing protein
MLKFLSNDVKQMIDIVKLIRAGKWVAAADKADMMDTAARELIPDITWELLQKHGSDNEINDSVKTSLKNVIREELQSLNETQTYSVTLKITFGAGDRSDITDAINQIKDIDTVLDVKIVGMNKIKEGVEPIVEGSERFGINATILGEGNATRNMIMKTLDKWENLPGITEIRTSRIIGGGDRDHSINTKK